MRASEDSEIVDPQTALLRSNWQRVQDAVAEACLSASREPSDVAIVGVSKYVDAPLTLKLFKAGCHILGENRPQQLWQKCEHFTATGETDVQWHMIGHLQRNKLRRTLPLINCLHSLDSQRLADAISEQAVAANRQVDVLLEANVSTDDAKTGVSIEALPAMAEALLALPAIRLRGLMAMSSFSATSQQAQAEFAKLRQLREALRERFDRPDCLPELSMGMSGDFREAIAEGATMVRIGSSLWEGIR